MLGEHTPGATPHSKQNPGATPHSWLKPLHILPERCGPLQQAARFGLHGYKRTLRVASHLQCTHNSQAAV